MARLSNLIKWSMILTFLLLSAVAPAQEGGRDSTFLKRDDLGVVDTTIDYDDLIADFDFFLDSLLSPRNYFSASISISNSYYNFLRKNSYAIDAQKKTTYSPTLGYYHRNGLGITATASVVNDGLNTIVYQGLISPSFDYIANKSFATGISYSRYFTKDSLPFYTTHSKTNCMVTSPGANHGSNQWWRSAMDGEVKRIMKSGRR